ncbi:MAG: hypothetical protein AAF666_20785 [Pseudomonadota bacterium]
MRADPEALARFAACVRSFLEGEWPAWHAYRARPIPKPLSAGTCQTTSLFLQQAMDRAGIRAAVLQGNDPDGAEGFLLGGVWHGHAWVEAGGYILDISGDQFGLPPTHVEPVGCGRYRAGSDTAGDAAKSTRWHLVSLAMEEWADGPAPAAVSAGSAKPRYRAD